jgi:cell division protein FtsQ
MLKLKRFLRPLGILASVLGVLALLGFVERTSLGMTIAGLDVRVTGAEGIHFLDEKDITDHVLDQGEAIMGASIGEVDLPMIEQRLRNIPSVARAEVYHTMNGVLHVRVKQREPVVRVFNQDGSSFYIDRAGHTMPVQAGRSARVLVITGDVNEPDAAQSVRSVLANDSTMQHSLLDDIHRVALFIREDPFWNAMIDHATVTGNGEFELVPKVGSHRILIGDGTALPERFEKLRIFYAKGIAKADWRRYSQLDLRFADQIVCTKRRTS